MKFYSEINHKFYDTEEELVKVETKLLEEKAKKERGEKEKAEKRKIAAAEVENARKAVVEANKAYYEKLQAFCKEYGSFHATYKYDDIPDTHEWIALLNSLFD